MKNTKFGVRVIALVLVMLMVASLLPLSTLAATKFDMVTDRDITYTGIQNDTLNKNGTINWPIKIYDYLADGMLFEYAQADGATMYSNNTEETDDYSGQYVLGKPMAPNAVGHDYTTDYAFSTQKVTTSSYESSANRYVKTKVAAVDYESPQYLRITTKSGYLTNKDPNNNNLNCRVANFYDDNGGAKAKADVRYMVFVYRANGIGAANGWPALALTVIDGSSSGTKWRFPAASPGSSIFNTDGETISDSSDWKVFVCDIQSLNSTSWGKLTNNKIKGICFRLPQDSASDYFEMSHIAFFNTEAKAKAYGEQCLEFIKEPGEYRSGNYWNGAGNDSFGMLYASNGGPWANSGGGSPDTSTNGGKYAGYWAQAIGGFPEKYESKWTTAGYIAKNRKDGVDSNGRYNGTGNLIGDSHMIYLMRPKSFSNSEYDMSELKYDGYNLLTKATRGIFTTGLLEGQLGKDGTPQYREETVRYIADMLSKTLVISRLGDNGRHNYNFIAGVKNGEQYGYTEVDGKQVPNDLGQALRNCLGITFSGNKNAAAPKMGTYAETLKKADSLKGAFLTVAPNINTCMDAAYYLLNNLFVANSYNQLQNDYRYLTLSSAKLDNGQDAYVFDGGFSNGASLDDVASGKISQTKYKELSDSAIEYSSLKNGGDGTISINKVDEKDYFYYTTSSSTTMYPFLPVTGAEGVYAGGTDSYYFAEDGKRSYTDEFGTYKNRNYNYVLSSNGEFVYHEEDNLFFEFEGDDDVYLFLNGQLVLDLGGGHSISACKFNVNDYVTWAREVLKNPANYTDAEVSRARALDLSNGEIATFDFYYMERHGYGANMRIVTNMHITDPALRVEKSAYQGGKQIEYGGIVDADDPIEYNFKLSNVGNTKLYNLTFDDSDIGVSLSPENGLSVVGDNTESELDDINGYYVTDARGDRLDAEDLTAVVTGYMNVGSGGNYIQSGHTYTKVTDGAGTHVYYDGITINFKDNDALKNFLKTLQSENTDGTIVDDELTQQGSGLWVDADVTFKGIYYTMTKDQEDAGMFDNTVLVTATTRVDPNDVSNETLRSQARHRVYVTAIPSYYQWADHDLYISKKRVLDDSSAEAGNESSMLHDYITFFNTVNGDITKFNTKLCDRLGNLVSDDYYKYVTLGYAAGDGTFGYKTCYPETGIYEFYLLMYLNGKSGNVSTMNLGEYAIVRVLIIVADVEDSEYVLDYGLSTENLDAKGELFKDDELFGSLSGTEALLMGVTNIEPSYMNVTSGGTDFNRINFNPLDLSESNKIQTEDGYYNVNIHIPEEGKKINYDDFSGMYTLTDTGTVTMHVDCPVAWKNVYLYYWYDNGRNNIWPGEKMTQTSHGNYELAIPGNVPHIIISNGTNQTVDLNLNPGLETWVDIPGTLNADEKLYATVEYKTADGIVHVTVPEDWGDVYYYCWDALGIGLEQWPGTKIEEADENGYYTFTIPGDITNVIINNGDNGKKTRDQVVYAGSETWLTVNDTVVEEDVENGVNIYGATSSRSTETVTMHASVPDDWTGASLYYWNSNGSETGVLWPGLSMTKGEDGLYHIEGIPADVTNVVLNNGDVSNNKQTHNITITPGVETWFDVKVKSGSAETKIEANVPSNWTNTYVYFFNEAGQAVGSAWPGSLASKIEDGVFGIDVPDGATKYIINNGSDLQTQDLKLILGSTNKVEFYGNKNARPVAPTELHIEPPAGWNNVYVHYWYTDNNGTTHGTEWNGNAAKDNGDGTFSIEIPAGYNKFVINNGSEQTDDITEFYMGIENHIKINDYKNDKGHNTYTVGMSYLTDIVYGENAEKEGFTFTPTDFMDSLYSMWLAITVYENKVDEEDEGNVNDYKATALGNPINIAKEVQMYKKITVIPASVVYYEDDFAGIKYNTDGENVITHYGQGSGSLSQSVDQNQGYGQDNAYQGSENDEITGGSLTNIDINSNKEFATFEFTGTGFEIIGHTRAVESGTVRVVVKDKNGNVVAQKSVITEFDNGADGGTESIVAVPIIRFSGLQYGTYSVSINGVPVYDFDNWASGEARPPVLSSYIYIDGVRIYQPLDNSNCEGENLALGMKYDAVSYTGSPYNSKLTDGKAETVLNNANWFGFKNTGDAATGNINPNNNNRAVFTVNLGCEAEISNIRLHHFKGSNTVGAGTFDYINVYYSSDGITFKYLNTINPDSTKTAPYWAGLDITSAPVTAKYIKFAVGAEAGSLILINEVEIYGKEITVPGRNDAYLPTENGASFTEIRNLIAERQAFAVKYSDIEGLSVSGGTNTWIENRNNTLPSNRYKSWKNNTVNSVTDYIIAGPNNEVYMIESTDEEKSALVFYVTEEALAPVHNMQVAIRALDYGAFIDSENKGFIHAEIQYGAIVDGNLVWKPLTTILTTAEQYYTIPYAECPYDAENNRYQVVLRVNDSDITGMASYTSVKLNGLKLNTLNTSEVPDIPEISYSDELDNTIIDNNGNTLDTSKFVDFLQLSGQMQSNVVMYSNLNGEAAPEGVDTSALGVLYDSFTADKNSNFVLTEESKIYIVTTSEDAKPSYETIETAQLVQTQFMADKRPTADPMEIVWGLEKYTAAGDILIYANESGYGAEEFKIVVTDRAKVYAADDNGLLYGLNTLQKHFRNANSSAIKGFTIQDAPDTKERALHLDVARKYQTVESVKNYIAEISWMGFNALELHFSEDGGFRMDFWGDTALSQVPGMTGNDFSWVCGSNPAPWVFEQFQDTADKGKYLTTEEVIEICQTAKQYNIEIIPSFDTPAHVGYMTELYYNIVNDDSSSSIRNFTYNGTNYTLPAQINYRNYTGSSDSRYDFSVLNLADNNVKNFAYAMYSDIAAFFKYYAGSTDFNIGADEVALKSSDVWTYTDFINYVNQVNAVLKSKGYRTRMYNDFLYNTTYSSASTGIDTDIDVVYWLAASSSKTNLRSASFFADQGRNVYSGVNFWTYYVLRIAPTSTATHMDARDPANRQWDFYRNQEDHLYNEWNASQFGAYTDTNMGASYNYSGDKLAGAYFMIWNDFAGLNTEVEVWNGCTDLYGKYSSGKYSGYGYNYSMIERMWSSGIKQWNADINSTLTFANFEPLRDSMGFFPGYVATDSSKAYANGMVLAEPTAVSDEAYRTSHTVTFVDFDDKVLNTQVVRDGTAANAPADPTRPMDVWYTYTFTGWDTDYSNITKDTVVKATYSSSATTAGKIGYLEVKVSGGTNFNMSMGVSDAKPMGISYVNPKMELGVAVTVTAQTTNGNNFIGWMDAKNGNLLTTSVTYSFNTSGNDLLVALFDTDLDDRGIVTFRNDKTNQVIDIQYYSSTDTIVFPEDVSFPGYEFMGWNATEAQIQAKLKEGKDVTVLPMWRNEDVYFSIKVNGGKITDSPEPVDGKYVGYKGTTVTANKASSGKIFAYWADENGNVLSYSPEYKFYPYKDTVITATYISTTALGVDIIGTKAEPETVETVSETFKVYFENNWLWTDVSIYYWGVDGASEWPGAPMTLLENNGTFDIYVYDVPTGVAGFIINGIKDDGSGNRDQTPDITQFVDGRQYSMTWDNGNNVMINDSRVESSGGNTDTQINTIYLYVSEEWAYDDAWFALYGWNLANGEDNTWVKLTNVNGNVYVAQLPAKYAGIKFVRMNPASDEFSWDNAWNQTSDISVLNAGKNNMYVLSPGWDNQYTVSNLNTVYFVNDRNWENITVTYTDDRGTYEIEAVFVEKDENGNDVYSMLIPAFVNKIVFSDGTKDYVYRVDEVLEDKVIFGIRMVDNHVEKDVVTNVDMDTSTLGDSNMVIFSWEVPEDTGYIFVNAGLLLVREEDYIESSFKAGTINSDVIQFVPARKYQLSTGIHSVTIPQVMTGDGWVACSFVQYRDEQGILRTKYSKKITGKK